MPRRRTFHKTTALPARRKITSFIAFPLTRSYRVNRLFV